MIPIRSHIDQPITTFGIRPAIAHDHPLASTPCPVCDGPLTDRPVTLVLVGVDPETRATGKSWVTGAGIVVHADCAGLPDPETVT